MKALRRFAAPACAILSLCGCAIPTAQFQSANTLEPGGFRISGGFSTGLHLEETAYHELRPDQVQKGGEPDQNRAYQRPTAMPLDLSGAMFLSAISLHAGVGIGRDRELTAAASVSLMAASGRLGLKYRFRRSGAYSAAVNPTVLYAISQGGSGPDDEITDGQQTFLQHLLNDKSVLGLELPLLMTWRSRVVVYNLAPSLAYYHVDISKAFHQSGAGRQQAFAAGLSLGTFVRIGDGGIGPEISLLALRPVGGAPIVNLNYGFGVSSGF